MLETNFSVPLKCLFCDSELKGDKEKKFKSGDLIICQECGEPNDFDSLTEIAKEQGLGIVKDSLTAELKKRFGNRFKPS